MKHNAHVQPRPCRSETEARPSTVTCCSASCGEPAPLPVYREPQPNIVASMDPVADPLIFKVKLVHEIFTNNYQYAEKLGTGVK